VDIAITTITEQSRLRDYVRLVLVSAHSGRPVLTAIQVDNKENRAFTLRCGIGSAAEWPWPMPYRNSVKGKCHFCTGDIWIGPMVNKERERRRAAGEDERVYCLLCAAILFGKEFTIKSLTRKKPGQ
jgi:hypothetical protein